MAITSTIVVNSVFSMLSFIDSQHVGTDRRGAGHADFQTCGKTRLLLQVLDFGVDLIDERHVVDGHHLVVNCRMTSAAWPFLRVIAADELPPDNVVRTVAHDLVDGRFFALRSGWNISASLATTALSVFC